MAYALLDDRIHSHPKFMRAGAEAVGVWALGLSFCADFLTDGLIPREAVVRFAGSENDAERVAARLCNCGLDGETGLWEPSKDGWRMHDYLDWNPPAKEVKAKRDKERRRKAKGRSTQGRGTDGRVTSARNPSGHGADSGSSPTVSPPVPTPVPTPTKEPEEINHAPARVMGEICTHCGSKDGHATRACLHLNCGCLAGMGKALEAAWSRHGGKGIPSFGELPLRIESLAREMERKPVDLVNPVVDAFKERCESFPAGPMRPVFAPVKLLEDRHWAAVVEIVTGQRDPKARASPDGRRRGQAPVVDGLDFSGGKKT